MKRHFYVTALAIAFLNSGSALADCDPRVDGFYCTQMTVAASLRHGSDGLKGTSLGADIRTTKEGTRAFSMAKDFSLSVSRQEAIQQGEHESGVSGDFRAEMGASYKGAFVLTGVNGHFARLTTGDHYDYGNPLNQTLLVGVTEVGITHPVGNLTPVISVLRGSGMFFDMRDDGTNVGMVAGPFKAIRGSLLGPHFRVTGERGSIHEKFDISKSDYLKVAAEVSINNRLGIDLKRYEASGAGPGTDPRGGNRTDIGVHAVVW